MVREQDAAYREEVLPEAVRARVSVEAGIALGWRTFVGDAGASITLEHFGASADYKGLYEQFDLIAEQRPPRPGTAWPGSVSELARRTHEGKSTIAMTSTDMLAQLSELGVAIWLDDLSRERLTTGNLAEPGTRPARQRRDVQPDDLRQGPVQGDAYAEQVADLALRGVSVDEAVRAITTCDIRWACDVLRPKFDSSNGLNGRVSIEVDPRLARDTEDHRRGARLWVAGGPAECVDQDSGHRRGPPRDHRSACPRGSASMSR